MISLEVTVPTGSNAQVRIRARFWTARLSEQTNSQVSCTERPTDSGELPERSEFAADPTSPIPRRAFSKRRSSRLELENTESQRVIEGATQKHTHTRHPHSNSPQQTASLDTTNMDGSSKICRRLDGIKQKTNLLEQTDVIPLKIGTPRPKDLYKTLHDSSKYTYENEGTSA